MVAVTFFIDSRGGGPDNPVQLEAGGRRPGAHAALDRRAGGGLRQWRAAAGSRSRRAGRRAHAVVPNKDKREVQDMARIFQLVAAVVLLVVSGIASGGPAAAQSWPTRPVTIVVPWAAGGITDILGRLFAEKMTKAFGQQFIVINKPGASGNIGAEMVAKSPPDGYTLLLTNPGAFSTNQFLYTNMTYKPEDFAGIFLIAEFPNALMVYKDMPVKSVGELIDYAKKHPQAVNGASSGIGSSGHLSIEMFKWMTGVQITNVFYKGAAQSKVDLAAGRVQMAIDNIPSYLSEIINGSVRLLAVGTRSRLPSYPDIPTLDEAGLHGYQSSVWYALAAPKGTPAALVDKINAVANAALKSPDIQKHLKELRGSPMGGSPADSERFFAEESKRWKGIIAASGAKIEN
jgi:tripartite-type tricarboxylate transporter receptor subunit TctC